MLKPVHLSSLVPFFGRTLHSLSQCTPWTQIRDRICSLSLSHHQMNNSNNGLDGATSVNDDKLDRQHSNNFITEKDGATVACDNLGVTDNSVLKIDGAHIACNKVLNISHPDECSTVINDANSNVCDSSTDYENGRTSKSKRCDAVLSNEEDNGHISDIPVVALSDDLNEVKVINQSTATSVQHPKRKRCEEDETPELKKTKLETKALKAKRPGFTDEKYAETSYWFENGLRKVRPYYFTFTTFTKGRWVGEKILDVFSREFRAHSSQHYSKCIELGTLTVNYQKVLPDHRLKHNDLLANIVHRHEVPVTNSAVPVVHMDEELVVVDKPSSIPVHPCGRYRHNTIVFILAKENGLKNLRTIHRLDRLTSGLLMFGRTANRAREMEGQIRSRQVKKEYVCRVDGEFPSEPVTCSEPVVVVSYKIGVCRVSPAGKQCLTEFSRISYNGRSSVVLCRPHTGRMHQIRVHLQYLGHPIVNDPLYNHSVFGPLRGRGGDMGGKSDDQLVSELIAVHNAENWLGTDEQPHHPPAPSTQIVHSGSREVVDDVSCSLSGCAASAVANTNEANITRGNSSMASHDDVTQAANTVLDNGSCEAKSDNDAESWFDSNCYECSIRYRDPSPSDLVMYLHALKYSGPGWSYETKMPEWAASDWQ